MHVHNVLIIGAGPAGLAVAARLREHTPSATFTDDEHQRYHWIKKHGRKMNIKNYKTNKNSLPTPPSSLENSDWGYNNHLPNEAFNMLVLDADGVEWMTKWNRLFKTFGIDYLRSPMIFQIDPADRDALLAYAYEKERERTSFKHSRDVQVKRFLGRTPDVDERGRKDSFVSSTNLFGSHCCNVIQRYGLGKEMLRQEKVMNIEYDMMGSFEDAEHDSVISNDGSVEETKVFRVTTDKGVRFASTVILAVGPGNAPCIPSVAGLQISGPHEGFAHAMEIKQFPPPHVKTIITSGRATNMLIVGGGLTSIQLADLAIKRGFDVELDWVGKFRNYKQAEFWTADTDEGTGDIPNSQAFADN